MERSHYQAKAAYFKNTRHGGGYIQSNAFHEMFNWFFHALTAQKAQKIIGNMSVRRLIMKVVSARQREGYIRGKEQVNGGVGGKGLVERGYPLNVFFLFFVFFLKTPIYMNY